MQIHYGGAPRIHGELLKLGINVSEATVSKYMIRDKRPPSQTWRSFLENHAKDIIAVDFLTVPTATFRVLFVLVILSHDRRKILHTNATEHPTAVWTARQLLEAIGTDDGPRTCFTTVMEYSVSPSCAKRRQSGCVTS